MGLDTIAYKEFKDGEHVEANSEWFEGTEGLSRGVMAWDLNNLRGKRYAFFVEQVSGINLYQFDISNEAVNEIADGIENFIKDPLKYRDIMFTYNYDKEEIKMLARWFRVAADKGCYLHGSW